MQDMQWCQAYAMDNKMIMRDLMIDIVNEFTGHFPDLEHSINIQQNHCNCKWCCYKDPLTGDEIDKKLWVTWKKRPSWASALGIGGLQGFGVRVLGP